MAVPLVNNSLEPNSPGEELSSSGEPEEDPHIFEREGDADEAKPYLARVWTSLPCIAAWFAVSVALTLHNKWLFTAAAHGGGDFAFPVSLMLMHQAGTSVCVSVQAWFLPTEQRKRVMPSYSRVSFTVHEWCKCIVPISVCSCCALVFGNMAMVIVTVHLWTMAKAVKPVLVSLLQMAVGLSAPSCVQLQILLCIALLTMGTVKGELNPVAWEGFVVMALMLFADSARVVVTQYWMQGEMKMDTSTMLYYVSPATAGLVAPFAVHYESGPDFEESLRALGVVPLTVNIALGVAVNMTSLLLIERTDALALELAGIVRDFILIVLSAWAFSAEVTGQQIVCYTAGLVVLRVFGEFKAHTDLFNTRGLLPALFIRARVYLGLSSEDDAAEKSQSFEAVGRKREISEMLHLPPVVFNLPRVEARDVVV